MYISVWSAENCTVLVMEAAGAPGGAPAMPSEAEQVDHQLEVMRAIPAVISASRSAYDGPILNRRSINVRARLLSDDGAEEVRLIRTPCSEARRSMLAAALATKEKLRLQLGSAAIDAAEQQVLAAAAATSADSAAAVEASATAAATTQAELQPEELPAISRPSAFAVIMARQRAQAQLEALTARMKEVDAAAEQATAAANAAAALVVEAQVRRKAVLPTYVEAYAAVYGERPSVAAELLQDETPASASTTVSPTSTSAGALCGLALIFIDIVEPFLF